MATYPDIQAAVPPDGGGPVGKTLLRNAVTARMPYILADDENPSDLVCVDPVTGAGIIDILYRGRLFHYDPTDSITDPDGVSCIVSNEGRRYKLSDGADVFAYSVLDNSLTAPPVSPAPSIGDAYLVAPAATGDWAGHDNEVAARTARGWEFINFGIGRLLYIEDIDAYYHRNAGGAWVSGFGNLTIGPKTVPFSAAINFGACLIVEDQTTTAPPVSPTVGTAYIIGPSATGDWSGKDGKIAICEVAGSFTIYNPVNGWTAFDASLGLEYRYNSTSLAWVSASGVWVGRTPSVVTASGSTTAASGTTGYVYSSGTAPTTAQRRCIDNATISYTAKRSGATLRFDYTADVVFGTSIGTFAAANGPLVIALYRDSVVNAVAWKMVPFVREIVALGQTTPGASVRDFFEIDAPDTSAHTYRIAIHTAGPTNNPVDAVTLTRRTFAVQEAA